MISSIPVSCRVETFTPRQVPIFSFNDEGAAQAGHYPNDGTLSPRQLAAFLSPRKTALRREQRQRHSSFLFRFRLFGLFSFPVGSSLPFRHNTVPYVVIQEVKPTLIPYGGDFKFCSANPKSSKSPTSVPGYVL
jgi:hypothetical protein